MIWLLNISLPLFQVPPNHIKFLRRQLRGEYNHEMRVFLDGLRLLYIRRACLRWQAIPAVHVSRTFLDLKTSRKASKARTLRTTRVLIFHRFQTRLSESACSGGRL